MPWPLILVDDPARHAPYDLVRVLSRRSPARLTLVVEPLPGATPSDPSADGTGLGAACATTAGAPVPLPRYRLRTPAGAPVAGAEFPAAEAAEALLARVPSPFVVVVFSSLATLPLVEALHADERTRPLLKLGITGWRLDTHYNLTQKLVAQGKLHYHEHGMSLERTLTPRLALMLRAHAARSAGAAPETPAPEDDAVKATA